MWRASDRGAGVVTVDAPSAQALIGHLASTNAATKNLRIEMKTPFTAITLGALDGQPIATSVKLLLMIGSRTANTGMEWNEKRTSLEKWGKAPVRLEPVEGKVILRGLEKATRVTAQPLDGDGAPLGDAIMLVNSNGAWSLDLGQPATPWYVLNVAR